MYLSKGQRAGWHFTIVALNALSILAGLLGLASCQGSANAPELTVFAVAMTAADSFVPQEIVVQPGGVVEWTNTDTDPHAPIVDPGNLAAGGPDSDLVRPDGVLPGTTYRWTVPADAAPGTVWFYHCRFHGTAGDGHRLGQDMVGVITVTRPAEVTVAMDPTDSFVPQTIHVEPGTMVVFDNTDTDPHAPIVDPLNAAAGGPDSDATFPSGVPAGSTYSWRVPLDAALDTPWYYHCRFHGAAGDGTQIGTGMAGVIIAN